MVLADDQRRPHPGLVIPFESAEFIFEPFFLQGSFNYQSHLIHFVGFGDVVVGSLPHCLDGGGDRGIGSDNDHFRVRILFFGSGKNLHSVHLFHFQVCQNQIESRVFQCIQGLDAPVHRDDFIALFAENVSEVLPGDVLVVDNKNPGLFHSS